MAELSRRQQAESDLNAQAMSFYKTAEVRTPDEAAPFEPGAVLRQAEQRPTAEQAGDMDLRIAEDSLVESPDMMITVLMTKETRSREALVKCWMKQAERTNRQYRIPASLMWLSRVS